MKKSVFIAVSMLAMTSQPAIAQQSTDTTDDSSDITVTATRVASLASKTPIALTAISGEDLVQAGISNPTQLQESVPNLSIVRGNGLQITIRGVTSTDGTEKGDPSAAFLLDGVYIARPQAQEVSFYDIERVEVLRGPQGTLYGRNTTAGVVNVISTVPKQDFQASASVSYQSYNDVNAAGMVNVPIAEGVAVRAAVNYDRRDNYIIGPATDPYTIDPFKENLSTRLSLLLEPSDALRIVIRGDYSRLKGTGINSVPVTNFFSDMTAQSTPTYLDPASEEARTMPWTQAWRPYAKGTDRGVMGELTYDLGPAELTYLGSYRAFDRESHGTRTAATGKTTFEADYWQTSHELRLAFGEGPLQAQVGGYYFKEQSGIAFFLYDLFGPNTKFGFPQDPTIAISKAVFGQVSYELLPALKLTGGIRYSSDRKSRVGATVLDTLDSNGDVISRNTLQVNDASRDFSRTTWRVGVDYDSALGLIYASVATGYKAGGFNDGCLAGPSAPAQCVYTENELFYQPETLTAYEAGFKFRLTPEIRLNGSIFHYDYEGLQLSQLGDFGNCGLCQLTTNAAKAKVDGIELESVITPLQGLSINLSVNWLDARYAEFTPIPTVDFNGHPLARSPEWTWSAGFDYRYPLDNGGSLDLGARTRYSSSYDLTDLANLMYFRQPSYTRTDLTLTYNSPNDRLSIGVFARNLENNIVLTSAGFGSNGTGSDGTVSFADPRTVGVRVGVRY